MSMRVTIRNTKGETQSVCDLDGYDEDEWQVLGIEQKPKDGQKWCEHGGCWKDCEDHTEKHRLLAIANNPLLMVQMIERLEGQVAQLISDNN